MGSTFGGDFEECYELVLREARTKFKWSKDDGVTKSVVVIGDATPHGPKYPLNKVRRELAPFLSSLDVLFF